MNLFLNTTPMSAPLPPMHLGCITRNERHLSDLLLHLQARGHHVDPSLNVHLLEGQLQPLMWDAAIVDLTTLNPGVLVSLRQSFLHLWMLAITEDVPASQIRALHLQADSVLGVPMDLEELEVRLHAMWRRKHQGTFIHVNGWWVYPGGLCHPRGRVHLTPTEEKVLRFLMNQPGVLHSRKDIMLHVGRSGFRSRGLGALVCTLRQKIPGLPLRTVRGAGYMFDL